MFGRSRPNALGGVLCRDGGLTPPRLSASLYNSIPAGCLSFYGGELPSWKFPCIAVIGPVVSERKSSSRSVAQGGSFYRLGGLFEISNLAYSSGMFAGAPISPGIPLFFRALRLAVFPSAVTALFLPPPPPTTPAVELFFSAEYYANPSLRPLLPGLQFEYAYIVLFLCFALE